MSATLATALHTSCVVWNAAAAVAPAANDDADTLPFAVPSDIPVGDDPPIVEVTFLAEHPRSAGAVSGHREAPDAAGTPRPAAAQQIPSPLPSTEAPPSTVPATSTTTTKKTIDKGPLSDLIVPVNDLYTIAVRNKPTLERLSLAVLTERLHTCTTVHNNDQQQHQGGASLESGAWSTPSRLSMHGRTLRGSPLQTVGVGDSCINLLVEYARRRLDEASISADGSDEVHVPNTDGGVGADGDPTGQSFPRLTPRPSPLRVKLWDMSPSELSQKCLACGIVEVVIIPASLFEVDSSKAQVLRQAATTTEHETEKRMRIVTDTKKQKMVLRMPAVVYIGLGAPSPAKRNNPPHPSPEAEMDRVLTALLQDLVAHADGLLRPPNSNTPPALLGPPSSASAPLTEVATMDEGTCALSEFEEWGAAQQPPPTLQVDTQPPVEAWSSTDTHPTSSPCAPIDFCAQLFALGVDVTDWRGRPSNTAAANATSAMKDCRNESPYAIAKRTAEAQLLEAQMLSDRYVSFATKGIIGSQTTASPTANVSTTSCPTRTSSASATEAVVPTVTGVVRTAEGVVPTADVVTSSSAADNTAVAASPTVTTQTNTSTRASSATTGTITGTAKGFEPTDVVTTASTSTVADTVVAASPTTTTQTKKENKRRAEKPIYIPRRRDTILLGLPLTGYPPTVTMGASFVRLAKAVPELFTAICNAASDLVALRTRPIVDNDDDGNDEGASLAGDTSSSGFLLPAGGRCTTSPPSTMRTTISRHYGPVSVARMAATFERPTAPHDHSQPFITTDVEADHGEEVTVATSHHHVVLDGCEQMRQLLHASSASVMIGGDATWEELLADKRVRRGNASASRRRPQQQQYDPNGRVVGGSSSRRKGGRSSATKRGREHDDGGLENNEGDALLGEDGAAAALALIARMNFRDPPAAHSNNADNDDANNVAGGDATAAASGALGGTLPQLGVADIHGGTTVKTEEKEEVTADGRAFRSVTSHDDGDGQDRCAVGEHGSSTGCRSQASAAVATSVAPPRSVPSISPFPPSPPSSDDDICDTTTSDAFPVVADDVFFANMVEGCARRQWAVIPTGAEEELRRTFRRVERTNHRQVLDDGRARSSPSPSPSSSSPAVGRPTAVSPASSSSTSPQPRRLVNTPPTASEGTGQNTSYASPCR